MPAAPPLSEKKRAPRKSHAPYKRTKKQPSTATPPRTSAKAPNAGKHTNLTLHDWLTVIRYVDEHPNMPQQSVVDYFRHRAEGALIFTQTTLSRNLKKRVELEARVNANPTSLSSKRPRVVTRPDVERALVLWVKGMEEKCETVNGPMLVEKRRRFEEMMNVPDAERLSGSGWVASFCKT